MKWWWVRVTTVGWVEGWSGKGEQINTEKVKERKSEM